MRVSIFFVNLFNFIFVVSLIVFFSLTFLNFTFTFSDLPDDNVPYYISDDAANVTEKNSIDISNDEALELSRLAWDKFFDPSYTMTAYNISFGFGNFDFEGGGGFGSGGDIDDDPLIENGTIVRNPIVFTDSFILPHGMQIWVPMNTSDLDLPVYQKFTVGGAFDNQRGGGFPLAASFADGGFGDDGFSQSLGTIYFPDRFSNYTTFFGDLYRAPNAYDSFLIKTSHPLDSPENDKIALRIEEFTNTLDKGYREIIGDNLLEWRSFQLGMSLKDVEK